MSGLEIIKNALLISLLLMLVYVLYKRMLKVISRDKIQSKYPSIGNHITWKEKTGEIAVDLKQDMYLVVEIYTAKGDKLITLAEGDYKTGNHTLTFDASSFSEGRYFYKVTSAHQESSQYFDI